jgi:3-oxoacyl-[acyl-carrier-protein] synthase-1
MPNAVTFSPCRLHPPALVCPLGDDLASISANLFAGRRGLTRSDIFTPGRPLPLGQVTTPLPDDAGWPAEHRSRNNRLLAAALERLAPTLDAFRQRCPQARIGVVLGTSTSGIGESEAAIASHQDTGELPADFCYQRHEIGASARFIAERLALEGLAYTLSTACTSSAKALTSARRLLANGTCDAVIAGGADSLCGLTVNGFAALEAISDTPCAPFSANRRGLTLGEAAALFLVTAEPGGIQLSGYAETSDAHHISAPRPDGDGARQAMQGALAMAGVSPAEVDYLNLHGTATALNDSMEARGVAALPGGAGIPCSSTKALTGHTLGACGALEAAFCWMALEADRLPPQVNDGATDPALPALALTPGGKARLRYALSNAFAFGGNNIALLLERTP